jgi:hypothetical protein
MPHTQKIINLFLFHFQVFIMFRPFLIVLIAFQLFYAVSSENVTEEKNDFSNLPTAWGAQAGNVDLGSCSYSATCTASGIEGVCVSVSAGCCSGTTTSNLCPGSSDIKCCTNNKCSTPYGSGTCMQTSKCSGKSYSGYCVGPSDLQCCVSGTPTPTSGDYGVDVSSTISTSTASCFKSSGNSFVIPRGYRSSGSVDTAVCTSIKNAASAGIKTRDTYMFPCK